MDADNLVFEARGNDEWRRNRQGPSQIKVGKGYIWVCGEDDVTADFLRSLWGDDDAAGPLVVTCKDRRVPSVNRACQDVLGSDPLFFNIGFAPDRERRFTEVYGAVKGALDRASHVILHCRAGVHRAALAATLVLMFARGESFAAAKACLENVRRVKLQQIIEPQQNKYGRVTEDHRPYIKEWEFKAKKPGSPFLVVPAPKKRPLPDARPDSASSTTRPSSSVSRSSRGSSGEICGHTRLKSAAHSASRATAAEEVSAARAPTQDAAGRRDLTALPRRTRSSTAVPQEAPLDVQPVVQQLQIFLHDRNLTGHVVMPTARYTEMQTVRIELNGMRLMLPDPDDQNPCQPFDREKVLFHGTPPTRMGAVLAAGRLLRGVRYVKIKGVKKYGVCAAENIEHALAYAFPDSLPGNHNTGGHVFQVVFEVRARCGKRIPALAGMQYLLREHWCQLMAIHLKKWPDGKEVKANAFCTGKDPRELPRGAPQAWCEYFNTWLPKPRAVSANTRLPTHGIAAETSVVRARLPAESARTVIHGTAAGTLARCASSDLLSDSDVVCLEDDVTPMSALTSVALALLHIHLLARMGTVGSGRYETWPSDIEMLFEHNMPDDFRLGLDQSNCMSKWNEYLEWIVRWSVQEWRSDNFYMKQFCDYVNVLWNCFRDSFNALTPSLSEVVDTCSFITGVAADNGCPFCLSPAYNRHYDCWDGIKYGTTKQLNASRYRHLSTAQMQNTWSARALQAANGVLPVRGN